MNADALKTKCPVPIITCEATRFALGLLHYNEVSCTDGDLEVCKMGVASFDAAALLNKCSLGSPNYDASLSDFDFISQTVFTVGEVWSSRELLHSALSSLAKLHGWHPRKDGQRIC